MLEILGQDTLKAGAPSVKAYIKAMDLGNGDMIEFQYSGTGELERVGLKLKSGGQAGFHPDEIGKLKEAIVFVDEHRKFVPEKEDI